MSDASMDAVRRYFEKESRSFDAIYSGQANPFMCLVNRIFRRGMYNRYRRTMEVCDQVAGKRILDVGCGSGRFAIPLALAGAEVIGIDFAGSMLDIAARLAEDNDVSDRCHFIGADFLEHDFGYKFDIVLAMGFFDYTEDTRPFLGKMRQLVTDEMIATFPRLWTFRTPLRKLRLSLSGCPVYFYTRSQVMSFFQQTGFNQTEIECLNNSYFVVGYP